MLHSKSWNDEKIQFSYKVVQKGPPETKKAVLKTHPKNFRAQSKNDQKLSSEFCFLRNIPMHTRILFLTTLPKKFANMSKKSRWRSEKDKSVCLVSKTFTLPRKVPPDMWIAVLKLLTKNSLEVRFHVENLKTVKKLLFFC